MDPTKHRECPGCGERGRKVAPVTPRSLLVESARERMDDTPLRFCRAEGCEVVYFDERHGQTFGAEDLAVTVFQKSSEPSRLVCYCFEHSVQSIEQEVRETGASSVPERIAQKCRAGLDRCESENPQGSCCLGNVRKVVEVAVEAEGGQRARASASGAACCAADAQPEVEPATDCCAPEAAPSDAVAAVSQTRDPGSKSSGASAGLLSSGGAVVGAILASACCWLPLALVGLGASTVGVAGFFEAYRPYFLGATGLFLAGGFYYVYFRKPKCAPGDACAVPSPRLRRFNVISLWLATLLVVVFATFPSYVSVFLGDGGPGAAAVAQAPTDIERTYAIDGMTCEGCAGHVRTALEELPGVRSARVSYEDGSATVIFEDGAYDDEAVSRAISSLGYRLE